MTIHITYAESCACVLDEVFSDGNKPEYFLDKKEAIRAFVSSKQHKQYFAIHLHGKHIMTVHIKGFCPCWQCKGETPPNNVRPIY